MVRVRGGALQLRNPPVVAGDVFLVLRVHGLHFPLYAVLREERLQEKLGKPAAPIITVIQMLKQLS